VLQQLAAVSGLASLLKFQELVAISYDNFLFQRLLEWQAAVIAT
jgi:hypothetical protein